MGIGGAGMSGLALLLDQIGCKVSGCDTVRTHYIKHLEEKKHSGHSWPRRQTYRRIYAEYTCLLKRDT